MRLGRVVLILVSVGVLIGITGVPADATKRITVHSIPTAGSVPIGIVSGPDGNLWFTEYIGNNIGRITTEGAITEYPIPTGFARPLSIASGPDGNLWFTEFQQSANNIGRITTHGVITEYPVPTASGQPQGVASGPDQRIWFVETNGNKVGALRPSAASPRNYPEV